MTCKNVVLSLSCLLHSVQATEGQHSRLWPEDVMHVIRDFIPRVSEMSMNQLIEERDSNANERSEIWDMEIKRRIAICNSDPFQRITFAPSDNVYLFDIRAERFFFQDFEGDLTMGLNIFVYHGPGNNMTSLWHTDWVKPNHGIMLKMDSKMVRGGNTLWWWPRWSGPGSNTTIKKIKVGWNRIMHHCSIANIRKIPNSRIPASTTNAQDDASEVSADDTNISSDDYRMETETARTDVADVCHSRLGIAIVAFPLVLLVFIGIMVVFMTRTGDKQNQEDTVALARDKSARECSQRDDSRIE